MTIITLTTDFGLADGYVGVMKGVILSIAPDAQLVDLSHDIAPQDVRQAAYVIDHAAPYFPPGTVHLAVVDPGVGSDRRALLVQTERAFFVGPDNGLFTGPLAEPGTSAFAADRAEFWLPQVSRTFHGRDIFAPLAAHLARGTAPAAMAHTIEDPVRLDLPEPTREPDGRITGHVVYSDRFGNLITDIPGAWLSGRQWRCQAGRVMIPRLSQTYADAAGAGMPLALISSGSTLELAVRNGSAARDLGLSPGAEVHLIPTKNATERPDF